MDSKDVGGKHLIDRDPDGWVRWLLEAPSLVVEEVLTTDFQFVGRRSDSLLRVRGKLGPFGVLTELQLYYDPKMPARMQNYTAMARQKTRLNIVPIVVYLTPLPAGVELPTCYHSEFMGLVTHQDFKAVPVWEVDAAEALAIDLPVSILPFVPLMAGADETMVAECARRIRAAPDSEELETVLALFAMTWMDAKAVERIVRWSMRIVLERSPIYQEILERGLERGKRESILRFLYWRFGTAPASIKARLGRLLLVALNTLLDDVLAAADLSAFKERLAAAEAKSLQLSVGEVALNLARPTAGFGNRSTEAHERPAGA